MKNIFVLYTGGTIGMHPGEHGLEPDPALAQHALAAHTGSLKADWHICEPLIDSSAVSPQHWHDWLQLLRERLPHYDGALVLHGTDTLAYTANLLALALDTGGKAVVLTGSQRPFGTDYSDAPAHPSLLAAAQQYCAGGRPLLLISQTPDGCAAPVYAQSAPLLDAGALAAGYCNTETAAALLLLAASNGWQHDDIRTELQRLQLLPAA